jgi:hypothetical protein
MFICLRPKTPYLPPPTYTLYSVQHTVRVYIKLNHTGKGGGGSGTREKVRGATVHKAGSKIPTWLTVSPVYKLYITLAAKSLYRSIYLDDDILLWCLQYIPVAVLRIRIRDPGLGAF